MPDDVEPAELTLTDRLAIAADQFEALLSMVAGYRAKAIDAGFSEYSAEEMACQVHASILDN